MRRIYYASAIALVALVCGWALYDQERWRSYYNSSETSPKIWREVLEARHAQPRKITVIAYQIANDNDSSFTRRIEQAIKASDRTNLVWTNNPFRQRAERAEPESLESEYVRRGSLQRRLSIRYRPAITVHGHIRESGSAKIWFSDELEWGNHANHWWIFDKLALDLKYDSIFSIVIQSIIYSYWISTESEYSILIGEFERIFSEDLNDLSNNDLGFIYTAYGDLLQTASIFDKSNTQLNKAASAYKNAIQHFVASQDHISAAFVYFKLGYTLYSRNLYEINVSFVEEALRAYEEAMKFIEPKEYPLNWASLNYHYGKALYDYGRHGNAQALRESIISFENVLKIYTRDFSRSLWSKTLLSKAESLFLIGINTDNQTIVEAIEHYQQALSVLNPEDDEMEYAHGKRRLGQSWFELAQRGNAGAIDRSIRELRAALQSYREAGIQILRALVQEDLALAMLHKGQSSRDCRVLAAASRVISEAIDLLISEAASEDHHTSAKESRDAIEEARREIGCVR